MKRGGGRSFVQTTRAIRIRFGDGAWEDTAEELDRLGVRRALLVTTARGASASSHLRDRLGEGIAGVFSESRIHVPVGIAQAAREMAERRRADGLLAVGGGSAIGVAKAVAVETGLPIVALPTTYSGSEMTAVWAVTESGEKTTGRDVRAAARTVIYDPLSTLELPTEISAASGMNAIAHAVEALYAPDAGPLGTLVAEEGVRALGSSLPAVVSAPRCREARSEALYGAHLAGWALDLTSMGLHHKLCHVLGGTFDLPHALVHAILLPHVVAFNAPAVPDAMARLGRALRAEDPALALHQLNLELGITVTLSDLGMGPGDLDRATELAVQATYPNPRRANRTEIRKLLGNAAGGDAPRRARPLGSSPNL